MRGWLGLSVGAAHLVAAASGRRPLVRRSVVTLFAHRPPEVGVPGDNPRLTEPGLVLTDFTDRVGDPVPVVAPDGSLHRGERLLVAALDGLTRAATRHCPEAVGVAVPAYWPSHAVAALRRELPGAIVVPDHVAALTAVQRAAGLPARGVVVVCDFGARGTSVTLADAGAGFRRVDATVRQPDFSGELIDQALLRRVLGQALAGAGGDPSRTAAVSALGRLLQDCRAAKERLSHDTATGVVVDGATLRVTRAELESLLRHPFSGVLAAVQEVLQRNRIAPADVAALVTIGGGARIPAVTEWLSQTLRLPVTTTVDAATVAASGAGLIAARSREREPATVLVPSIAPHPRPEADGATEL